jgi:TM2 domain-containing membrane protein YozV
VPRRRSKPAADWTGNGAANRLALSTDIEQKPHSKGVRHVEESKVDMFMMINNNNFPTNSLPSIRQRLLALPDDRMGMVQSFQLKSPSTAIIISVLIGAMGIDRFYIGDTGLGIAKLLTCGGVGIWTIVDWFLIMGLARQRNHDKFVASLI